MYNAIQSLVSLILIHTHKLIWIGVAFRITKTETYFTFSVCCFLAQQYLIEILPYHKT